MSHHVVLRSNLQTENFVTIQRAAIRFEEEVLTSTSLCQHRCGVEILDVPSQAEAVTSQILGPIVQVIIKQPGRKGKSSMYNTRLGFFVCFVSYVFYLLNLIFISYYSWYNFMLVSGAQQSDSVTHISILFQIRFT